MLNVVRLGTIEKHTGVAMLLGGFDGLHQGHFALLERAKESGLPIGIMTIVGGKDKAMFTFEERETFFKRLGIDFVFELPFDEIKGLSPLQFLRLLEDEFVPKLFVCGDDFRFGFQAKGTPEFLKTNSQVCVEIVELIKINNEKVSATAIKQHLKNGEVQKANSLLCHDFFLQGKVEEDRKVGRTIGFPTANIRYPKEKFEILEGVYETWTEIDGKKYKGITNFGARPTFDDNAVWTETHIKNFDGDLYGQTLCIHFVKFMRPITKFETAKALSKQLQKDLESI